MEFKITTLSGDRLSEFDSIAGYMVDLFFEDSRLSPDFSELVCDVQLRIMHKAILPSQEIRRIVGISSIKVAEELTPEYGGTVNWLPGYGEDTLGSEEFVCIVPADYPDDDRVELLFEYPDEAPEK